MTPYQFSLGVFAVSAIMLIVSIILFSTADASTNLTPAYVLLGLGLATCFGFLAFSYKPQPAVATNDLGF